MLNFKKLLEEYDKQMNETNINYDKNLIIAKEIFEPLKDVFYSVRKIKKLFREEKYKKELDIIYSRCDKEHDLVEVSIIFEIVDHNSFDHDVNFLLSSKLLNELKEINNITDISNGELAYKMQKLISIGSKYRK